MCCTPMGMQNISASHVQAHSVLCSHMTSHSQPIVMVLSDVLRGTEKEKVKRIILATLRVCTNFLLSNCLLCRIHVLICQSVLACVTGHILPDVLTYNLIHVFTNFITV